MEDHLQGVYKPPGLRPEDSWASTNMKRSAPAGKARREKEKLWSRDFSKVVLISLFTNTADFTLITSLPLYISLLGGTPFIAGLATMVFSLSALLTRPLWGGLSDRIGRRKVLVAGAVMTVATVLLYQLEMSVAALVAIRLISGVGFSALTTAAHAAAADLLPESRLAEGLGFYGVADTVATAAGPAIGFFLYAHFGYQPLLLFVLVLTLLNLACAWMLRYEWPGPASGRKGDSRTKASALYDRQAVKPSLTILLVGFSNISVVSFLVLFGLERGIEPIGGYFTVLALAIAISRLLVGRMTDKFGITPLLLAGLSLHLASFLLLALSNSLLPVLVSAALSGFGGGVASPLTATIIVKQCDRRRTGAALSTMYIAIDLGIGLGALLWGYVIGQAGFTTTYLAASALIFSAGLWHIFFVRGRRVPAGQKTGPDDGSV